MDRLELRVFVVGALATNCYLIFDKKTKKSFIVDLPSPISKINNFISKEKLEVLFVILTHAHFDHIGGLRDLAAPFYVHQEDVPFLEDSQLNFSTFLESSFTVGRKPLILKDRDTWNFLSQDFSGNIEDTVVPSIEIIHTPGHTPGSIAVKFGKWLFSGDTIFLDSVGRTDIPLASSSLIIKSIKEKIFVLPSDTIIYPGHGPSTTVGREKQHNPFLAT